MESSMLKTAAVAIFAAISLLAPALAESPATPDEVKATKYCSMQIDGLTVAYREAGPPDAPTVLLLHGFPSSSRMYQRLFPLLSDRYHLVAPDYVGFGHSDAPDPSHFDYTFDHLADIVAKLVAQMGLTHYALFMQDYGGPIGFRLALRRPEAVDALIVQNAVAHEQGLGPLWAARRAFWADRAANEAKLRASFLSYETTKARHVGSSPRPELYDPDSWTDEFAFLERPGQADIQTELFYDYRNNVASYPAWQAYLRQRQPPTLVLWGKYDPSFAVAGAAAYAADVPKAQIHLLDAGHFAMDEDLEGVAKLTREFLDGLRRGGG
jgi:pimeloyl-ACP methyl ester carboxylesterase